MFYKKVNSLAFKTKVVFRVLYRVLIKRLCQLDMKNFFAALSIMLVLKIEFASIFFRSIFSLCLNLIVYLHNDYCDLERDFRKDSISCSTMIINNNRILTRRLLITGFALLFLVAILWDFMIVLAVIIGAGTCLIYSAKLKHIPILDIISIFFFGSGMTLIAVADDDYNVIFLVILLGFFASALQAIQLIDDYEQDRSNSLTTTAVFLGKTNTLWLARGWMFLTALYSVALLHRYISLLLFLSPILPLYENEVQDYRKKVILVFGLTWVGILSWLYFYDGYFGLIKIIDLFQVTTVS